jgi:hypothetical protein
LLHCFDSRAEGKICSAKLRLGSDVHPNPYIIGWYEAKGLLNDRRKDCRFSKDFHLVLPERHQSLLRSWPTFHVEIRSECLRGAGSSPRLTIRQTVDPEQLKSASTTGCRTFAELGSESKFLSASGIALRGMRRAMLLSSLRRYEHGALSRVCLPNMEEDSYLIFDGKTSGTFSPKKAENPHGLGFTICRT